MKLVFKIALPMTSILLVVFGMMGWFIRYHLYMVNADAVSRHLFDTEWAQIWGLFLVSCVLLTIVFSWMMRWFIIRPLERLSLAMKKVSEGNLDNEILYDKQDELGDLVRSFEKMRRALRASIEETQRSRDKAIRSEAQAKQQVHEVERLNELMVSREIRMAELKKSSGEA